MPLNNSTGEDSWESLGQQGHQTSSILKEINHDYSFIEMTDAEAKAPKSWPVDTLENTLILGKIVGKRIRVW